MRVLYLLLLLPLAASCSYTMYISDATERGGVVHMVNQLNHGAAVEKAEDHCRDYNLVARTVSEDPASGSLRFVCQPPGAPTVPSSGI